MNPNDDHIYEFVRREDSAHVDGPFEVCRICRYPAPLCDFNADLPEPLRREHGPEYYCCLCANAVKCDHPQAQIVQGVILYVGNVILNHLGAFAEPRPTGVALVADQPTANGTVYSREDLQRRWKTLLAEVRARNSHLTEEEIEADIDAAIAEVRAARQSTPNLSGP